FYGAIGEIIGLLMVLLGVVEFVVAWGYLTQKGWARWAGLILAAIGLVEGITTLPTGALSIAIDGVIIYYLTRPHIIDWFAGRSAETPPPLA
ncbi:TPA: hypothetical protein HA344_00560, partial [Candidatus Bathyarchaeota archaeon]|nr:hypothetical protein [Candidatus Bathyarchaeota archaeon]